MRTHSYPIPANESKRLAAVHALDIIGSARDPAFDSVVALACRTLDVPIAAVSFLDEHQQWFKAFQGLSVCSTERESAFCNYTITSGKLTQIQDALSDDRVSSNRLVTGAPFIRCYAGIPISLDPGVYLGALCIIDIKPRRFTRGEIGQLRLMAEIVEGLLRQHRDARAVAHLALDLEERNRVVSSQAGLLERQKNLFDRASALTKMGAWEWSIEDDELTWTNGMYDMHELPRGSQIDIKQVHAFYSPSTREALYSLLEKSNAEKAGYTFEGEITTAKGNTRWVRLTAHVECENGVVVRRYGVKQDITEQKATLESLRFLAECDPLTELPNRTTFQKRLDALAGRIGESKGFALLLVDIDGFKQVNDTFGHQVGDECLKQIAKRLKRASSDPETVARLGGDEFAMLQPFDDAKRMTAHAHRILAALRRPIRWRGQAFQLSGSIGIAVAQAASHQPSSELLIEADLALYAAKAAGRNTLRVFVPDMKRKADEQLETIRKIGRALDRQQLELFYQPIIDLSKGDELAGFEALLRWRRPDGQVIAAGAFTAALEDPELSVRIGDWVLKAALDQAQAWNEAGLCFGHIAINLGPCQFQDATFADGLIASVARRGLRSDMIKIEVTEGVFLSRERDVVQEILESLREAGFRIALDDFGTGFASLSHLRTYPVDTIKIDRSFVQHFLTSLQDHAILQSTLFLARHLKLDVVAEGIEETEQCEFLRALGCRYGQGYLFSKAVCATEAAEWCLPVAKRRPKAVA